MASTSTSASLGSVSLSSLQFHATVEDQSKIECKCKVGDGFQRASQVRVVSYYGYRRKITWAVADCRLGAHQDGSWWLIVTMDRRDVPEVVDQMEIRQYADEYYAS